MININKTKGFTLIELLLCISLSSFILIVISIFLSTMLQSRTKNETIAEVEQQGIQLTNIINQSIRNSKSINTPSQGTSSETLSLETFDLLTDPTVFSFSNGEIIMSEGGGNNISLINSRVEVSNLFFNNNSQDNTPGIITTNFSLDYINNNGGNEYTFGKDFFSSSSLRGGIAGNTGGGGLVFDATGANIGGRGNLNLSGVIIENTSGTDIIIDKITVVWTGGTLIKEIRAGNTRVWRDNNEGTPDGPQPSGTELDIVDYTISALSSVELTKIGFDGDISGDTFSIILTLSDGSTEVLGNFSP